MRVCPNCKTSNFDVETKCTKCGYPLSLNPSEKVIAVPQNSTGENTVFVKVKNNETSLQRVARGFMIFSCVCNSLSFVTFLALWIFSIASSIGEVIIFTYACYLVIIFPLLIISICMTNSYSHKIASGQTVGIGFKIATLLLVNTISGILMLCDND